MINMTKIQNAIKQLEYDFSNYTTESFIDHISKRRKRVIWVDGIPMSHHTSGAYIETPILDFILYNNQRNPFMQTHFILHEIGHMVLEHTQHKIILDIDNIKNIQKLIGGYFAFRGHFRIQHPSTIDKRAEDDDEEREAEQFVRIINSQRYANNQLDEIKRNSNIALMPPFISRGDRGRES